jgi:phospholipid-binding lipoprotein MlaA
MRGQMGRRAALAALLLSLLLGGCASSASLPPQIAARPELAQAALEPSVLDVYDPIERFNRRVYIFNAGFDEYVFLPIVRAYEFVTPEFVRDRVTDFFANLGEITTVANSVLQLKPEMAARSATRFIVNTMFTLGLYDLAGAGGVERAREDFGQTLGYWGAGDGSYLVLPILGPSNLRDATGRLADTLAFSFATPTALSDSTAYSATRFGLQPIDIRHRTDFRYYQTGSPFEYDLVRLVYTNMRRLEIEN